jgi:hypothetical protein
VNVDFGVVDCASHRIAQRRSNKGPRKYILSNLGTALSVCCALQRDAQSRISKTPIETATRNANIPAHCQKISLLEAATLRECQLAQG